MPAVGGPCTDPAREPSSEVRAYERYRAEYERRRAELIRRDAEAQQDPVALQRWPRERKALADAVDQALRDWEVLGHKAQVEAADAAERRG
jgi:hypothetical protein